MQTADFNYKDFSKDPRSMAEADKGMLVKFFLKVVPKRGEPGIYEEVEYIDKRAVGSRDSVVRPARPGDIDRFPEHYSRFKLRTEEPLVGTPLKEWAIIGGSLVEQLSYLGIKTVEQVSAISDANMVREIQVLGLREKAKEWLARRDEDATAAKLQDELVLRDDKIAQLTEQIEMLTNKINSKEK